MADQDILHKTELVKAALPYLDSNLKTMAELFVKASDLMGSLKSMKSPDKLAACGFTASKIDLEGLLTGIRPVCNKKEGEIIDRILGFFNMKKMFEMYNNMMETMKTMQEFGGFSFGDSGSEDVNDSVKGNFSSPNFESIFQSFQSGMFNNSNPDNNNQSTNNSEQEPDISADAPKDDASYSNNNSGKPNNMMFEMLKTMVPPEQISTFENLSMLLNTMSYDSNSRPDNKE